VVVGEPWGRPGDSTALGQLVTASQVDDRAQAELAEIPAIGIGQAVQPVGPKQPTPPDRTAARGGIPTKVAKVEATLEIHEPLVAGDRAHHARRLSAADDSLMSAG
jgi:hypothetical protein